MKRALQENWPLFLGMMMLMVSNGLLVTLLTVRANTLGFSAFSISVMQTCYPLGALIGTMTVPRLVEKVGHIRVFSALASMVSVSAIVHLLTQDLFSWSVMRFMAGACFPGLYVITESWLNAKSENQIRAQVLSIYFIIQLIGPALGTAMVALPDPSGNLLFGIVSILMSVSIVPMLLSTNTAPEYVAPDRMPIKRLYKVSPMTVLGIVIMSIAVSAWYISLPLFALQLGYSEASASGVLVLAMIVAAVTQYPVGWVSDHTDRRYVVIGLCLVAVFTSSWIMIDTAPKMVVIGYAIIASATVPVYSILAAHANDQLSPAQVVSAAGAMAFLLQLGQVIGMLVGPNTVQVANGRGLQIMIAICSILVLAIAVTRRVQSAAPEDTGEYQAAGFLGVAQPGMIQAEFMSEEDENSK